MRAAGCMRAQMVSDRDKGMRAAALAILERLHAAVGAHSAWSLLGPLKDQQRSLIEERIRHRERHPDAPVLADAGAGASTSYVSHWCAAPHTAGAVASLLSVHMITRRPPSKVLVQITGSPLQLSAGLCR